MPYMNVITAQKCSKKQREAIKAGAAKVLESMLGKEERGIFVTFVHTDGFYRAGEDTEDSAILDLKYIGEFPLGKKQELTHALCALMRDTLGCDPEKVIVPITEKKSADWGRRFGSYQG